MHITFAAYYLKKELIFLSIKGVFSIYQQEGEIRLKLHIADPPIKGHHIPLGKPGDSFVIAIDEKGSVSAQK